jgi:hypothetical protein
MTMNTTIIKHLFCCILLCSAFAVVGCAKPDTGVPIGGIVSYDGKPIESGRILFVNEKDVPTIFMIQNGKYSGNIMPGEMTVRIWGEKIVKLEKPIVLADTPEPITETFESIIPPKYNTQSTLKQRISDQTETLDFSLEK